MSKFVQAIVAIFLGFSLTGLLAAVLIPVLDNATSDLAQDTRSLLVMGLVLALLALLIGFTLFANSLIAKSAVKWEEEERKQQEDPNFERRPVLAFIVLAVICLGVLAYELLVSSDRNTNIPNQIGQNAVFALLLFAAFRQVFGKHLSKNQKSASYVVLLGVLSAGSVIGSDIRTRSDAELLSRMQESVLSLVEGGVSEDGRIAPIELSPDAGSLQPEAALFEAHLTEYLNEIIANNNNYITELDAIGYSNLLDGERIRTDDGLTETRYIIDRTIAIIDRYDDLNVQTAYKFRDGIDNENVSEAAKASFKVSFDEGLESSLIRAEQIWTLERDIVFMMGELVNFLALSQSSWETDGDEFVFQTNKGLEMFNSFTGRINVAAQEQAAIREESANVTREIFEDGAL